MRIEYIISWMFFIIGGIAVVSGLKDHDTWLLCLGILLWWGFSFFDILINRQSIIKLEDALIGKSE